MYTNEMLESIKKVEANREANAALEPRRMTAEEKDALLEKYVVAKLSEAELRSLEPGKVAGVRRSSFGAEALVERSAARGLVCDPASIEDIMLYFLKGESK